MRLLSCYLAILSAILFIPLVSSAQVCGVNGINTEIYTIFQPAQQAQRTAGVTCHTIDVAVAVDSSFVQRFGSEQAAAAEVDSIFKNVNTIYETVNFSLRVVELVYFTAGDPYELTLEPDGETDPGNLLTAFSDWGSGASGFTSTFDVGTLISGRDFSNSTTGLAFTGAACLSTVNFNISMWSHTTVFTSNTVAHEIGHNLGASHDGSGNACNFSGFLMSAVSSTGDPLLPVSTCSQAYFSSFINSGMASCIFACLDDGDICTDDYCDQGECLHTPSCPTISGIIRTEADTPVAGVQVILSGDASDTMVTGSDGMYSFTVAAGGSYTVTPSKSNDALTNNGITTLDITLIRRHVLGSVLLDSPFKIIAADGNDSEGISTLDISLVRRVILDDTQTFPDGRLWQFVNSDHNFDAPPYDPFPFPNTRTYTNLTQSQLNQDFIGVKLGDVNESWENE